jgi:probable F420-dependent oxidoreductase
MAAPESGPVARLAEELGFTSIWAAEHMVVPRPRPDFFPREPNWNFGDPLICLAHLAAYTQTIELCTGVIVLSQRHPVHLAKELATLDVLSNGRVVAGVGIGYLKPELAALGVPLAARQRRSEEYLSAMRALWTMKEPEFHGEYVSFSGVDAYPRPVRADGVRIVLGGQSDPALRRAARFASGWYGWGQTPAELETAVGKLQQFRAEEGKSAAEFCVSVTPTQRLTRALVRDYAAAGADQLVISMESDDLDGVRRRLIRNAPLNYL